MYFAYILKSEKDGRYYYGSSENIERRIARHNKGDVKATKSRRPLILHYKEEFKTRSEAFLREHYFKTIDGYNWLKSNQII
jgi:putative endonuclease